MPNKKTSEPQVETLEESTEKGYIGPKTDPTPDSAYTVSGVTSGAKTPETSIETDEQGQPVDAKP